MHLHVRWCKLGRCARQARLLGCGPLAVDCGPGVLGSRLDLLRLHRLGPIRCGACGGAARACVLIPRHPTAISATLQAPGPARLP